MISVLTHLPLPAQIVGMVVGGTALAYGTARIARAAARYVTARGGQNWETMLLLAFFAAAASLSAHGLIGFASRNMGLWGPFPVIFWLALDGAAGMLLSMIRRRARAMRPIWHVRIVAWMIIAASAAFNWMHAPSSPGAHLAWAAMPVIAGILAELAVEDIRQEAREEARRKLGPLPARRVEVIRWLHPVEMLKVMSVMTADASVSSAEATCEVRADAAARALYRLRRTMAASGISGSGAHRRMTRRGKISVWIAEFIAQAAFRRAGFAAAGAAPEDILRRVQVLVRVRDFATLDYGTAEDAKNVIESLISGPGSGAVLPEPGTAGTAGTVVPARAPELPSLVPGTTAVPVPVSGSGSGNRGSQNRGEGKPGQSTAGKPPAWVTANATLRKEVAAEMATRGRPALEDVTGRKVRAAKILTEFREKTGAEMNLGDFARAVGVSKAAAGDIRRAIVTGPEGERSGNRQKGTA